MNNVRANKLFDAKSWHIPDAEAGANEAAMDVSEIKQYQDLVKKLQHDHFPKNGKNC